MMTITNFGDIAVLLPLSAIILIWLIAGRRLKAGGWWLLAVGLCTGATAVLKIYFYACPVGREIVSPSGHTAFSILVYGTLALILIASSGAGWWKVSVGVAAAAFILAIAVSRAVLGFHSGAEVAFGLVVGTGSLAVFARGYLWPQNKGASPALLVLMVVAVIAASYGREGRAEHLLDKISRYLHVASWACA
jgi:cation-transporting P-type ATPase E